MWCNFYCYAGCYHVAMSEWWYREIIVVGYNRACFQKQDLEPFSGGCNISRLVNTSSCMLKLCEYITVLYVCMWIHTNSCWYMQCLWVRITCSWKTFATEQDFSFIEGSWRKQITHFNQEWFITLLSKSPRQIFQCFQYIFLYLPDR